MAPACLKSSTLSPNTKEQPCRASKVVVHNPAPGGWHQSTSKTGLRDQLPHSGGQAPQPPTLETCPAHKHTCSSCSPVSQTARMGASSQPCPTVYPQQSQSQPNHNRKAHIFHTGHSPGAPGHGDRGTALLGPTGDPLHKVTLPVP